MRICRSYNVVSQPITNECCESTDPIQVTADVVEPHTITNVAVLRILM